MTSEAHSSGSDFVGNPGKRAIEVDVFYVIFPRDVKNNPERNLGGRSE